MSRAEDAVSLFEGGHNCAQAILSTYGVELGIDLEGALKLACGFGGGMARMAETCGAVTGAFMGVGAQIRLRGGWRLRREGEDLRSGPPVRRGVQSQKRVCRLQGVPGARHRNGGGEKFRRGKSAFRHPIPATRPVCGGDTRRDPLRVSC